MSKGLLEQVVSQSLLSLSTSLRVDRFERPRSSVLFFFFFFYFYLTGFYPYLVSCISAVYENMIEDNGLDERGSFKEEFCFCKFV